MMSRITSLILTLASLVLSSTVLAQGVDARCPEVLRNVQPCDEARTDEYNAAVASGNAARDSGDLVAASRAYGEAMRLCPTPHLAYRRAQIELQLADTAEDTRAALRAAREELEVAICLFERDQATAREFSSFAPSIVATRDRLSAIEMRLRALEAQVRAAPTCAAPQTLCSNACVDTRSSVAHCGTCGHACANGEVCGAGVCRSAVSVTPPSRSHVLGWTLIGGGAALAGTGAALVIAQALAPADCSTLPSNTPGDTPCAVFAPGATTTDDLSWRTPVGGVMLGVGVAAAVVGVLDLTGVLRHTPPPSRARAHFTGNGLTLTF